MITRLLSFLCCLALTSAAAGAQTIPPPSAGILEQTQATMSVPAERLTFTIRNRGNYTPGRANLPPSSPGSADAAEKIVVDSLQANGVADAHVTMPVFGNLSNNDVITGTITNPTRAGIAALEARVIAALPATVLPSLTNVDIAGMVESAHCSRALESARAAAFADALKRAQSVAEIAGMHAGGAISISETDNVNGCTDVPSMRPFGNAFAYENGSSEEIKVSISVTLAVTFAIRP